MLNQFVALAFVQHEHVHVGFAAILASPWFQENSELLQHFSDCFLETWIALPTAVAAGASPKSELAGMSRAPQLPTLSVPLPTLRDIKCSLPTG